MKIKYKMFASKMRDDLYKSLKLLSVAEGRPIQSLLEEAVTEYLDRRRFSKVESSGGKYETKLSVSYRKPRDKK